MAKTAQLSNTTQEALNNSKAKMGVLPLNARKGEQVEITEAKLQELDRDGKVGAIKGLLYAGNGNIYDKYECILEATDRDAPQIEISSGPKKGQKMPIPIWAPVKGADRIEIIAATTAAAAATA